MMAPIVFSAFLVGILFYAWSEQRRAPAVAIITMITAAAGIFFVWFPSQANALAELAGIGRGADLVTYVWILLSLLILFNLHLKLRSQMELITDLAREISLLKTQEAMNAKPSSRSDGVTTPVRENVGQDDQGSGHERA
jgi:hypothetical protein